MAVLKAVARVEAAELGRTAPRQGTATVESVALVGAAGQAVAVEAATVEAAALVELAVMVEVTSGQGAAREEVATLLEAAGQAAVMEAAAALVETAV